MCAATVDLNCRPERSPRPSTQAGALSSDTQSADPSTAPKKEFELCVLQQPVQARMCGRGEKADRRPIDPPPIIRVRIKQPSANGAESTFACPTMTHSLFCFASLVPEHSDEDELYLIPGGKTSHVTGSVVSSLFHLKDQSCFVFPDLSVRTEGRWRFKMSLYEIVEDGVHFVKSLFTSPFQCYSSKRFPGMSESTELSRAFASQGLRLRIRRSNKADDEDEDEDDNPRPRKKQSIDQLHRRSSASDQPPPAVPSARRISHPPSHHQLPPAHGRPHADPRDHRESAYRPGPPEGWDRPNGHSHGHGPPPPAYERGYPPIAVPYSGWSSHYAQGGLGVSFGRSPPHPSAHRLPPPPPGYGLSRSYSRPGPGAGYNYPPAQYSHHHSPPAPYEQFARTSNGAFPPPPIPRHSLPSYAQPSSPPQLAPIRANSVVSSSRHTREPSDASQSSTSLHRPMSSTPTSVSFGSSHLPTPNPNKSPRGEGWERERDRVRERERERRLSGEADALDHSTRAVRQNESSVRGGEDEVDKDRMDVDRRSDSASQEPSQSKGSLAMLLGQASSSAKEAYSAPDFV